MRYRAVILALVGLAGCRAADRVVTAPGIEVPPPAVARVHPPAGRPGSAVPEDPGRRSLRAEVRRAPGDVPDDAAVP